MSILNMIDYQSNGQVSLTSPTDMPNAVSFLWNKQMMVSFNCRGYAVGQFMQPEPAKYAKGPNIEATTFIQPEHPYYSHHPGRFFYIKDETNNELFSVPYAPIKKPLDKFNFIAGQSEICWHIEHNQLEVNLSVTLPVDDAAELWRIIVKDLSGKQRKLHLYSYFPVGYMSWMNQSAHFDSELNAIVCQSVTPYQKVADYFKNQGSKDNTVLISQRRPDSFETRQGIFEGESGLTNPEAIQHVRLDNGEAKYETPVASMHFALTLDAHSTDELEFVFAPVANKAQIKALSDNYLPTKHKQSSGLSSDDSWNTAFKEYIDQAVNCIDISTPHDELNHFVNHWLARQVFYHGDVNRLSTDPQTRNYLQDAMGMVYIKPQATKDAFITALSQQHRTGAMPNGILLNEQAELKYINQVPHTDHCVWLVICLQAYLDETNDYSFLQQTLPFKDSGEQLSVFEHINLALEWLVKQRDHRGLSYIAQGDWCDPMNMVGYKGKGVSSWLSLATSYALRLWSNVAIKLQEHELAEQLSVLSLQINDSVNQHCWDGNWYGRGITDDGVKFGVSDDVEGRIYANPQSFALLANASDEQQSQSMIEQVQQQLFTPFGLMMLAPSYTQMREDVGRVTQKYPGSAENGSVYNHAAIFYAYALYDEHSNKHKDTAWQVMSKMLPSSEQGDQIARGQLPVFIPNYYRGAYFQHPDVAGKSSQLFNTGTVAWYYRCLIEKLFGLQGCERGLKIAPQLPSNWPQASVTRRFRGATFEVDYKQSQSSEAASTVKVRLNGQPIVGNIIDDIEAGKHYKVNVELS
ncbi:amylo-alpha-1,6-glucosidase [Shewanella sp. WXL01]|uniref:GH36-type glycosyl hydrolase domain-containing protein n=1 Tax=Shewanella sp. WXL01 TaxID=2709721 RepID=UPI001AEBB99F|nr:amylo-alpha-1,6-glucosidase [Shewanella sp. WXL01]